MSRRRYTSCPLRPQTSNARIALHFAFGVSSGCACGAEQPCRAKPFFSMIILYDGQGKEICSAPCTSHYQYYYYSSVLSYREAHEAARTDWSRPLRRALPPWAPAPACKIKRHCLLRQLARFHSLVVVHRCEINNNRGGILPAITLLPALAHPHLVQYGTYICGMLFIWVVAGTRYCPPAAKGQSRRMPNHGNIPPTIPCTPSTAAGASARLPLLVLLRTIPRRVVCLAEPPSAGHGRRVDDSLSRESWVEVRHHTSQRLSPFAVCV